MSSGSESPYRVVYSGIIQSTIKDLLRRARKNALAGTVAQTLLDMDFQLSRDPIAFGDPWYTLPNAQLLMMGRMIRPLQVVFGVHLQERLVFVQRITPVPTDLF